MNTEEIARRIRPVVLALCRGAPVEDDTDLFAMGLLTSLYALRLVEAVERELGCRIPDGELKLANFRSVCAIAQMVARLEVSP